MGLFKVKSRIKNVTHFSEKYIQRALSRMLLAVLNDFNTPKVLVKWTKLCEKGLSSPERAAFLISRKDFELCSATSFLDHFKADFVTQLSIF